MLKKQELENLIVKELKKFRLNEEENKKVIYCVNSFKDDDDEIKLELSKYESGEIDLNYYKNNYLIAQKITDEIKNKIKNENFYEYYLYTYNCISDKVYDDFVNNNYTLNFEYEFKNIHTDNKYKIYVYKHEYEKTQCIIYDDKDFKVYEGDFFNIGLEIFNRYIFRKGNIY